MLPLTAYREAGTGVCAPPYARHQPERNVLYPRLRNSIERSRLSGGTECGFAGVCPAGFRGLTQVRPSRVWGHAARPCAP